MELIGLVGGVCYENVISTQGVARDKSTTHKGMAQTDKALISLHSIKVGKSCHNRTTPFEGNGQLRLTQKQKVSNYICELYNSNENGNIIGVFYIGIILFFLKCLIFGLSQMGDVYCYIIQQLV